MTIIYSAVVFGLLSVATYQDLQTKTFQPILSTGILAAGAAYHGLLTVTTPLTLALPAFVIAVTASSVFAYYMYRLQFFTWADAYIGSSTLAALVFLFPYTIFTIYWGIVIWSLAHHRFGADEPPLLPGLWIGAATGIILTAIL